MRFIVMSISIVIMSLPSVSAIADDTLFFGPKEYLQSTDVPDGFCEECQLEDFEDNQADPILSFDCGEILLPNTPDPLRADFSVTDSVDGDDGEIDGLGNGGHSWFCVDPARGITINFATPVAAAGAVWTDGGRGVVVQFEAYDADQNSLGVSDNAQFADDLFFGETAEDRFIGVRHDTGIASLTIRNFGGTGIEIDHVTWDSAALAVVDPVDPTESLGVDELCFGIGSGSDNIRFDVNQDGVVDSADLARFLSSAGSTSGDANLDGEIQFDDYLALSLNFGVESPSYSQGDFDCNGAVEFSDFLELSRNFGGVPEGSQTEAVPEPATFTGLLLLITCACFVRRRHVR